MGQAHVPEPRGHGGNQNPALGHHLWGWGNQHPALGHHFWGLATISGATKFLPLATTTASIQPLATISRARATKFQPLATISGATTTSNPWPLLLGPGQPNSKFLPLATTSGAGMLGSSSSTSPRDKGGQKFPPWPPCPGPPRPSLWQGRDTEAAIPAPKIWGLDLSPPKHEIQKGFGERGIGEKQGSGEGDKTPTKKNPPLPTPPQKTGAEGARLGVPQFPSQKSRLEPGRLGGEMPAWVSTTRPNMHGQPRTGSPRSQEALEGRRNTHRQKANFVFWPHSSDWGERSSLQTSRTLREAVGVFENNNN